MSMRPPFPLQRWIDDHRAELKPPVGNKVIYTDAEFIVMVVGGPNARTDFHINESEELFYMVEGYMVLRVEEGGVVRDIPIREGEIFLLPANVPHSPQRGANSIGIVIERTRREGELDGLRWYCDECHHVLHEEFFALYDIVEQLRLAIEKYTSSPELHVCSRCGTRAALTRPFPELEDA